MNTHQHTEHPSATDPGQEPIAMRQEDFDNLLAYAENPEKFENFPWRDSLAPLIKTFEEARLAGTPSPRENIARGASLSKDLVVNPQWRDTIRDAIRASSEQSSNTKVLAQVVGEGNRAKEVADVLGLKTSDVQDDTLVSDLRYNNAMSAPNPIVARDRDHLKELVDAAMATHGDSVDLNFINVSNVTDMKALFKDSAFDGDVSRWDTRNVVDMSQMFENCPFNGDISQWNTGNATTMRMMFHGPAMGSFQGDLSNWDVSKVQDMYGMFMGGHYAGDLRRWDTSSVTDMTCMFANNWASPDISTWDTSNVVRMEHMFEQSHFNGDISRWNVSKVESMKYMFSQSRFAGDISAWDVSRVETMAGMFKQTPFDGDISNWNTSRVTQFNNMFKNCHFKGDLSQWAFHPEMDFAGMVSPENLLQMVHPNLYHWANVLEKQGMHELLDNNPTWRAHFDALMPLLNGLGLGRHECARELQTRWLLGVGKVHDALPLPDMEH